MTARAADLVPPALLALGPLVAGAAGFGFATVPLFAAIALLWLGVRDGDPMAALTQGTLPGRLLVVLAQCGIAALALMLGRGMAGLAGVLPAVPLLVPAFLSLLAVAVTRRFGPGPGRLPARIVARLDALPPAGATPAALAPMLDEAVRAGQGLALLAALEQAPAGFPAASRARALLALRPEVAPFLTGTGRAGAAVLPALRDADAEFLRALVQAVAARRADLPALAGELPDPAALGRLAEAGGPRAPAAARGAKPPLPPRPAAGDRPAPADAA